MKISGKVEVGILMKVRYRTAFGNPVVVPEGDAKFGKISKCSQKCLCHLTLKQVIGLWISSLDRGQLDDSKALIKVENPFRFHRDIWAQKRRK
jgi:hypothetical protein